MFEPPSSRPDLPQHVLTCQSLPIQHFFLFRDFHLADMLFKALSVALAAGSAIAVPVDESRSVNERNIDIEAVIPPIVPINTRAGNEDLITKLRTSATAVQRFKHLSEPGDWVFDFSDVNAPVRSESKGKGGLSIAATSETMPALIGNGNSMTVAFLGPCGMNTPHIHPRATELNIVVQGRLVTNFFLENGAKPVANTLKRFQMAVFPQGASHVEFNPDCEETVFVAGFNNEDAGVNSLAQSFFALRPDITSATLGGLKSLDGKDIESFRELIPANIALGIDACLDKCGIKRNAKRDLSEFA